MKKLITILTVLALLLTPLFVFTACGGNTSPADTDEYEPVSCEYEYCYEDCDCEYEDCCEEPYEDEPVESDVASENGDTSEDFTTDNSSAPSAAPPTGSSNAGGNTGNQAPRPPTNNPPQNNPPQQQPPAPPPAPTPNPPPSQNPPTQSPNPPQPTFNPQVFKDYAMAEGVRRGLIHSTQLDTIAEDETAWDGGLVMWGGLSWPTPDQLRANIRGRFNRIVREDATHFGLYVRRIPNSATGHSYQLIITYA